MKTPPQPGDIDFACTDKLNRQARRRSFLRAVADIVAPAVIILAAIAVGRLLCATWTSN